MSSIDWTTVADLSTGFGTLVLAVATFASVRSANRTARLTERSLQADLRPLLLPSRFQDVDEKVGFADGRWFKIPGGRGFAEVDGRRDLPRRCPCATSVPASPSCTRWHLIPDRELGPQGAARRRRVPPAHPRPLHPGRRHRLLAGRAARPGEDAFADGRRPSRPASGSPSTSCTATTRAVSGSSAGSP